MEKIVLSEKEKRDIRDYLESGKPLPEKYRFLLFAEKKVELVWEERQIFDWARIPESFHKNILNNYEILNTNPNTICLYSAASMFFRSLSAVLKSCASKFSVCFIFS